MFKVNEREIKFQPTAESNEDRKLRYDKRAVFIYYYKITRREK